MKETINLLCDLIRHPSISGNEEEVMSYIANAFAPIVDEVELVPIPSSIVNDPDYSDPIRGIDYDGRFNIRAVVKGSGGGKSLIVNTHADVVPPSEGQDSPFIPMIKDDFVYGRGACDAKGQIALLWRALKQLRAKDTQLKGDLILHIVVEEENGGNGTLALVRRQEKADSALVLEPTDLRIVTASRGAVWFRVICKGYPGHVGSSGGRVSALESAIKVIGILQAYHNRLLTESKGILLFDDFEDPMPITFGKLHSGNWPATVPGEAVLEGVFGFLPNRTKEWIMTEMHETIVEQGDPWLRENFDLEFTFRHDCHVTSPESPLVEQMKKVIKRQGQKARLSAMPSSSDAWLYNNQLTIPTVIFGPGQLTDAHSNDEKISVVDIDRASDILKSFILAWCES
jgi:acetylornithine deacetylase